jgi:hypothetical protein
MASLFGRIFSRLFRRKTPTVDCAICKEPVRIEDCKTDSDGQPVHEHCHFQKIKMKRVRDGFS